ncbi:carbohydrate binding domain-containing protein [Flaviflexus equikiangi]|uniref:CBM-cenC domain-containing protein n=1 Tax=Flaviflexus equikiangi TaxID=2758573 RepID=A0ABS2TEZ2_9ACTO|nr:hypothetical protein [Flaviflexus equikiangi]MBM9432332.1 hypothetical protein [Flaviflexus equikiangi]
MTTMLGSYPEPSRSASGEAVRIGVLKRLTEGGLTAIVTLAGAEFELPILPGRYTEGATVSILESNGKPRRVIGPAGTWPESLEADSAAPIVTAMPQYVPEEMTDEERDLVYGADERISQVAQDTDEALSQLSTDLANLGASKNSTTFSPYAPGSTPGQEGDLWFQLAPDGNASLVWRYVGDTWAISKLAETVLGDVSLAKLRAGFGKIDEAVITKLGVDGLDARAIRTSVLHVAAGNLIPNGDGQINNSFTSSWVWSDGDVPAGSSAQAGWTSTTGGGLLHGNTDARIRVDPNEEYLLTFWAKASSAGTFRFAIQTRDAAYQPVDYFYRGPTYSVGPEWQKYELSIPPAWLAGPFVELDLRNATSPSIRTAGWDLRPKVGGRLVVDGVIDGKTVVGAEFWTSSNTANAVRMNQDGISAFINGVEQVRLSQNVEGGLAVRNPFTGTLVPLTKTAFGNVVMAPTRALGIPAASDRWTDPTTGEIIGRFTTTTTRYMVLIGGTLDIASINSGFSVHALGARFVNVTTGAEYWTASSAFAGPVAPDARLNGATYTAAGGLSIITTIQLPANVAFDVDLRYRAMKPSGITGNATVLDRSILLMPIH